MQQIDTLIDQDGLFLAKGLSHDEIPYIAERIVKSSVPWLMLMEY